MPYESVRTYKHCSNADIVLHALVVCVDTHILKFFLVIVARGQPWLHFVKTKNETRLEIIEF